MGCLQAYSRVDSPLMARADIAATAHTSTAKAAALTASFISAPFSCFENNKGGVSWAELTSAA